MPRFFNTAGPCDPADPYTLPAEPRLPEKKLYFVLRARAARLAGAGSSLQHPDSGG